MEIVLDDDAQEFIAEKGFDPKFGARPLRRAIQQHIEDPLAEEILRESFSEGDRIIVKRKSELNELYFTAEKIEPKNNEETKIEEDTKDGDEHKEEENPSEETVD